MRRNASLGRFGTLVLAFALIFGCANDEGETAPAPSGVQTKAIATALPAGATVVVSGYDLEGFWSRLQGTRLYQELAAIQDVRQTMAPLQDSQREIQEEICVRFDEETILSLFGGKFDLGFYGPLPEDRADLLLVAEVEDEDRARTIVEECESQLVEEKGATFRDEEIGGSQIRVATNQEDEEVLFYALEDGSLRIATTLDRMRAALAGDEGAAAESMTSVEAYSEVLEKLPDATLVVWVDQQALRQAQRATADTTAGGEAARQGERLMAATSAIENYFASALGVGVHWSDSGIRSDVYARFPDDADRSGIMKMMAEGSGEIQSLSLQPESTLMYGSFATLDARLLYEEMYRYAVEATRVQMDVAGTADSMRADSVVSRQLQAFEAELGIDVEEEIVAWIGEEIAMSITGVDRTGFFPVPEVAFTIEASDTEKARASLAKLESVVSEMARARASIPLQWQEETYEEETIRYAPTPMGEGLSVAYVVTDPFVLLASSRGLVKRMLDARAGSADALPANEEFGAMTAFYPQEATTLGYMNIEAVLTEVEGMLSTFGQMSGNAAAADTASSSRKMLDALKNAPRLGFYGTADPDGVMSHFLLEVR